jgi:hypothetical protein
MADGKIGLCNCQPTVVSTDGSEITLRFKDVAERLRFEEAINDACLSPDEFREKYNRQNDIDERGGFVSME